MFTHWGRGFARALPARYAPLSAREKVAMTAESASNRFPRQLKFATNQE
jgi:hypothetical protein